jgi:hypothetical protein
VAQFNIRVLTVQLGTFNTNMLSAFSLGKEPTPEDYKGSVVGKTIEIIAGGKFPPDGDKNKATKVIYEVVVAEGVGAGHEGEKILPLGRDLAARMRQMQDQYTHSMEVFGDICNNVYIDQ